MLSCCRKKSVDLRTTPHQLHSNQPPSSVFINEPKTRIVTDELLDTTYRELTEVEINTVLGSSKSDEEKLKYFLVNKSQPGFLAFVEYVSKTSKLSTYKIYGNNLAHIAAAHNFHQIIKALRQWTINIDEKNAYGESPLHVAIRYGCLKYIEEFLKINPNLKTTIAVQHNTLSLELDPLSYAILYNQREVVNYFLGQNDRNEDNVNISHLSIVSNLEKWLELAVAIDHYDLLGVLVLNPKVAEFLDAPEHSNIPAQAFCKAVELCNTRVLKLLAARFPQVVTNPLPNYMPLHKAVDSLESEIHIIQTIECLLELGIDINKRDGNNQTVGEYVRYKAHSAQKYLAISNFLSSVGGELQARQYRRVDYKAENLAALVLVGGGAKGLYCVGALEKLIGLMPEIGLSKIRRLAGTSAGAIVASLVAVGIQPAKLRELMLTTQIITFIDEKAVQVLLDGVAANVNKFSLLLSFLAGYVKEKVTRNKDGTFTATMRNIQQKHGLCDGSKFLQWLETCIETQIKEVTKEKYTGKNLTFGELHKLTKRYPQLKDLHIVVTDISDDEPKPRIFSSENPESSDYVIARVVRASMSIPGVFTVYHGWTKKKNGEIIEDVRESFVDGGLIYNNPVNIFDYLEFQIANAETNQRKYKKFNEHVIGFALTNPRKETGVTTAVESPVTKTNYLARIGRLYYNAEELLTNSDERSKDRLIQVDCGDVTTLTFNLKLYQPLHMSIELEELNKLISNKAVTELKKYAKYKTILKNNNIIVLHDEINHIVGALQMQEEKLVFLNLQIEGTTLITDVDLSDQNTCIRLFKDYRISQDKQLIDSGSKAVADKFALRESEQLSRIPIEIKFARIPEQFVNDENRLRLSTPNLAEVLKTLPWSSP